MEVSLTRKSQREPWKLLSKLATKASTHEQVAKQSREKSENPKFSKNFLNLFHDWDFDLPVSRENLLSKFMTGGMWLDLPATKSPKQGCTVFEIFDILQKKNTFQKQLKH